MSHRRWTVGCDRLIINHPRLWMIDYDNDLDPAVCVCVCVLGGYPPVQLTWTGNHYPPQHTRLRSLDPSLCFLSSLSKFFYKYMKQTGKFCSSFDHLDLISAGVKPRVNSLTFWEWDKQEHVTCQVQSALRCCLDMSLIFRILRVQCVPHLQRHDAAAAISLLGRFLHTYFIW